MHPRVEKQAALGRRRLIHTYLTRRRCGQVKTNRTCRSSFQSSSSHVKLKIACSNTGQSDNQFPGRRNIFLVVTTSTSVLVNRTWSHAFQLWWSRFPFPHLPLFNQSHICDYYRVACQSGLTLFITQSVLNYRFFSLYQIPRKKKTSSNGLTV